MENIKEIKINIEKNGEIKLIATTNLSSLEILGALRFVEKRLWMYLVSFKNTDPKTNKYDKEK